MARNFDNIVKPFQTVVLLLLVFKAFYGDGEE